jgi:predicted ATPase with chaperone activity
VLSRAAGLCESDVAKAVLMAQLLIDSQLSNPICRADKEASATIRARVEAARERQRARMAGTPLAGNADMWPAEIRTYCRLEPARQQLMRSAMQQLGLRRGRFTGL